MTKRFAEFKTTLPITDLEEKLKISSFTFGFELEAILNPDGPRDQPVKPKLFEPDKDLTLLRHKALEPTLGLQAKFGGDYTFDRSVKPHSPNHTPFEYVSGVIPFTDVKLLEFTKSLLTMKAKGVYTNDTCGFHIHFGFPDTTRKQLLWIKTVYLFDQTAQQRFEYFQSTNGPIPFWSSKYANPGDKRKLKIGLTSLLNAWKKDPNSLGFKVRAERFFSQSYFTGKYTALGIHEKYRTLEWRGPRGFLQTGQTRDIILFIRTLRSFVKWLSSAEDTNRIIVDARRGLYIDRQEFFDMVENHTPQRVNTFAADIVDKMASTRSNAKRAEIAFEFFKNMDLAAHSATNYRKIANKIKARYPTAWSMFQTKLNRETTIPQKIKLTIKKLVRKAGLESYNEENLSFLDYTSNE